MKALVIKNPNDAFVDKVPLPKLKENEVRIKVMASGICGTDVHIYDGDYLGEYPMIPGHEFSGEVVEIGNEVTRFKMGDSVAVEPNIVCNNCLPCLSNRQNFCENWTAVGVTRMGGMAQFTAVPETNVFSIKDLSFESGAFVEPLSCVIHGLMKTDIKIADKVALIGAGPIGMLILQVLRLQGACQISVVEKNPFRLKVASDVGADAVYSNLSNLDFDYYDVVIDATGVTEVMGQLVDYVRPGGKVLFFGVPSKNAKLSLEAFSIFKKGLVLLSSYTSKRNSFQAVDLLLSNQINVEKLISHRISLGEFTKGINNIKNGMDNVMKVIVLPNE